MKSTAISRPVASLSRLATPFSFTVLVAIGPALPARATIVTSIFRGPSAVDTSPTTRAAGSTSSIASRRISCASVSARVERIVASR